MRCAPSALALAGAVVLAACTQDGRPVVNLDLFALQAKVEEMTSLPPAEQCSLYLTVKALGATFHPELLAKAQAVIDAADFVCAPPAPAL